MAAAFTSSVFHALSSKTQGGCKLYYSHFWISTSCHWLVTQTLQQKWLAWDCPGWTTYSTVSELPQHMLLSPPVWLLSGYSAFLPGGGRTIYFTWKGTHFIPVAVDNISSTATETHQACQFMDLTHFSPGGAVCQPFFMHILHLSFLLDIILGLCSSPRLQFLCCFCSCVPFLFSAVSLQHSTWICCSSHTALQLPLHHWTFTSQDTQSWTYLLIFYVELYIQSFLLERKGY